MSFDMHGRTAPLYIRSVVHAKSVSVAGKEPPCQGSDAGRIYEVVYRQFH